MDSFKKMLDLNPTQSSTKTLMLYMLLAYLFSVGVRLFLYYQIADNGDYFYNGNVIPLWTPDAGLYGFYANQLLDGVSYPFIAEYIPAYLLYGVVNLTGINLDTALFFTPAFLSSLVVIPIILIANSYKLARFGLYAGLIGSLMTSYYYRTHLGYYDTDILNAVFPLLGIYFLIQLVEHKKIINAFYASLTLIAFGLWYHSSTPIILSIVTIFLVYTLLYERKETYAYQSLFILLVALLPLASIYKIVLLILLPLLIVGIHKYKTINYRHYLLVFLVTMVAFLALGNTSKYYERVNNYIYKTNAIEVASTQGTLKLKSDLDSVIEARGINLSEITHRVSGATSFFILALLGYLALLIRYQSMLLTLPLALLTSIAMVAGLRFTIYGVMLFSFSMVFGVHLVFKHILVTWGEFSKKIYNITSNLFLLLVMLFALNTIVNYNKNSLSPTFFSYTNDMKTLNEFKSEFKKDDFMLTWWDYGWVLWYYLNTNNTLTDNGKHQQDNFIASKILLSDNQTFTKNASIFFTEKYKEGQTKGFSKVMDYFAQNYSMEYLNELKKETFTLPKSDRTIYILLHKYMLKSLSTIESFSNINLESGKNYPSNFMDMGYLHKKYETTQNSLQTDKFTIDIKNGEVKSEVGNIKIRKISIVEENKIIFEKSYLTSNSSNIVINNGQVLLLKPKLYNSFLVQALLFNNYNRDYFTKVAQTKNFMILKVK